MSQTIEVKEISDTSFEQDVLKSDKPVLVDFWAPWCGPCRMVSPIVEELAGEDGEKGAFYKLNVDDNPRVSVTYAIRSIPTLLFFKSGKPASSIIGAVPKKEIKKHLDKVLGAA